MTHAPRPRGAVIVESWRCVVLEWVPSITAGEAAPGTLGGGYIRAPAPPVKGLAKEARVMPRLGQHLGVAEDVGVIGGSAELAVGLAPVGDRLLEHRHFELEMGCDLARGAQ